MDNCASLQRIFAAVSVCIIVAGCESYKVVDRGNGIELLPPFYPMFLTEKEIPEIVINGIREPSASCGPYGVGPFTVRNAADSKRVVVKVADTFSSSGNQDEFKKMLEFIQGNESEVATSPCYIAGAHHIVRARVSQALPLKIDDILSYTSGVKNPGGDHRYKDLIPGDRLIVESGVWQEDKNLGGYSGFGGAGSQTLVVTVDAKGHCQFNAFLAGLDTKTEIGGQFKYNVTNSAGLSKSNCMVPRNVCRLYVPKAALAVDTQDRAGGSPGKYYNNPVIAFAEKLGDLPVNPKDDANFCLATAASGGAQKYECRIFFGRAALTPEQTFTLNGHTRTEIVGMSIRDVISESGTWPPSEMLGLLSVNRRYGTQMVGVDFIAKSQKSLSIPIQRGDRIRISD